MKRGEVVILDVPFPDGTGTKVRPALIVQADSLRTKSRVHFDGRVLLPEEPVDLPIGESADIRVGRSVPENSGTPGRPSAVLAAALSEPHVSNNEDVAELERAIVSSKLTPASAFRIVRHATPLDIRDPYV